MCSRGSRTIIEEETIHVLTTTLFRPHLHAPLLPVGEDDTCVTQYAARCADRSSSAVPPVQEYMCGNGVHICDSPAQKRGERREVQQLEARGTPALGRVWHYA